MITLSSPFPDTLLPTQETHPYYIIVPPYVRTSAGVRALHVLCHWLNMSGYNAFLYLIPRADSLAVNPRLQTPILHGDVVDHHFEAGLTPVVVYPEVMPGNPLAATVRARWVANYPGLLGGEKVFDGDEICFAHSTHLARSTGVPTNILCIPTVDTNIFRPSSDVRKGTCYYARKFQTVHGQSVFGLPPTSVEITRATPATRSELAALFHRSELFYCFEDSALINEAALCGCPVVMMKNDYFEWPLGIDEVGWDGYAWGDHPSEIERAKATVTRAYDNYIRNIPQFFSQLHTFVLLTQARARVVPYRRRVSLPGEDSGLDEPGRLRQALANALLDLSTLKAATEEDTILWTPALTASGTQSAVTFVSGWQTIDATGAVAGGACGFTVCPGDAVMLDLALELDATGSDPKNYELVHDFEVRRQLTLIPGRVLHVTLAVLEAGRPVFIAIAASDPDQPGKLVLRTIKGAKPASLKPEPEAKARAYRKTIETEGAQFCLNKGTADRLQPHNCSLDFRNGDMNVEAFAPDPHILVNIVDASVGRSTMPSFLWGAYKVDRDERLQVYMPAPPTGAFLENVSSEVALRRGEHVFVMRLPRTEGIGPIRIDPLDLNGRICFTSLRLIFFQTTEPRPIVKSALTPRLERFKRQSLLNGAAFPLADNCVAGYAHNAFEIRATGDPASVIFYFAEPIDCVEDRPLSLYLAYESTLAGHISIRFPDRDGSYSPDCIVKDAEITKSYQTLELQASLSGPLQSLQLVLHNADTIRFFIFEIAIAHEGT